jgi:hypothetical protein
MGCRIAEPGKKLGRTDRMLSLKEATKAFSEYQTDTLGLDIDEGELLDAFTEMLSNSIVATEGLVAENGVQLTPEQENEFKAWQKKADVLAKNTHEAKRWQQVLTNFCGLRARSSQRATSLSQEEELERMLMSWRVWDKTCQVVATADPAELGEWVANPDEFSEYRRETEISLGDQGPAWFRLEPGKLLTSLEKLKEAKQKSSLRQKRRKLEMTRATNEAELKEIQQLMEEGSEQQLDLQQQIAALEESSRLGSEDLRQNSHAERTGRISPGEPPRWRVTMWARQGIRHWFNPAKKPEGFIKRSILIVYGVHCRCENISQEGTWLEDEKFYVNGQLVERKKGEAVRANIMQGYSGN